MSSKRWIILAFITLLESSKDDFIKAGVTKAMKSDKGITIDPVNKKVIAKFESFINRK